jgi:hypothetical protein
MVPAALVFVFPCAVPLCARSHRKCFICATALPYLESLLIRVLFLAVYVYRLALEYARLWADDLEAMSYEG